MTPPKDSADLMKLIDENLRRVYREEDTKPVPDRFKDLLEKLRAQDCPNE